MRVRDGQPPWGRPHPSPPHSVRRRYPRHRSSEDPQDVEGAGEEDGRLDAGGKRSGDVSREKRRGARGKDGPSGAEVHVEGRRIDAVGERGAKGGSAGDIPREGRTEQGDAADDGPGDRGVSTTIAKDTHSQHSINNKDEATATELGVPSDPPGHAQTADQPEGTATASAAGGTTRTEDTPKTLPLDAVSDDSPDTRKTRNALELLERHAQLLEGEPCTSLDTLNGRGRGGRGREGVRRVHEAETTVTVVVKDINDNFPVFPNATMYAEVQENGPVGKSYHEVSEWMGG